MIALPGLTIYNGWDAEGFEKVLDSILKRYKNTLEKSCNCPDAPLWLFRTLQEYISWGASKEHIFKKYGKVLKSILKSYINGEREEVALHENGLLWAEKQNVALSWMHTYIDGKPVTERNGYQIELNALWYNALVFYSKLEHLYGSEKDAHKFEDIANLLKDHFDSIFWIEDLKYYADFVNNDEQNKDVRPNQLIACALEYSPADDMEKMAVLNLVKKELLTPRGIRTLSPKNNKYRAVYEGDQIDRDLAHFNGCVMPWLLGMYIELNSELNGASVKKSSLDLLNGFEEDIDIHGVGSVAEMYDGNPSHKPHGCISSALSISEILRGKELLKKL